ncbi:hypothetical protein PQR46_42710 [Paraburkholderia sediminicola]|uniref:hypothetical protein n=1 Tax=Paraburkholderia sediminicola TaxID=458836 RepID=UPI0038BD72C2
MQQVFDPLVIAQMLLAAGADISFAVAVGSVLVRIGGAARLRVVRTTLVVWLVLQALYLPLQASAMSGTTPGDALAVIPLVIAHSHFGLMWMIGAAAGVAALIAACVPRPASGSSMWASLLMAALIVTAFAHAASTHAADAGDFSVAELAHTLHLLATAGWAGVVITAAGPLRRSLTAAPNAVANIQRVSDVTTLSFVFAIGTGLMNAYRGLGGSLASLTSNLWGQLLQGKVLIVIITIGAVNRLAYLRHLRAGDPRALPALMRLLTGEAVLVLIVLMLAGVLGHSIPAAAG